MVKFAATLLVVGIVGFWYCSQEQKKHDPVPPGLSISQAWEYPAGKWETGAYACAGLGAFGVLMLMMPKR